MARNFNGTTDGLNATWANVAPWSGGVLRGLSAWIKTTQITAGGIFDSDNNINRIVQFKLNANKLNYIWFSGGVAHSLSSATSINTGLWVHVGGTWESTGTVGTVFVNGNADGTLVANNSGNLGGRSSAIGAQIAGVTQQRFAGVIAEVALWTLRKPTAQDMASLARGLPASHVAADAYWPLWGVDGPEPTIGASPSPVHALTGTTQVSHAPISPPVIAPLVYA